jgi:hypothetical protein
MRPLSGRSHLGQEQSGKKEWMGRQFNDASLTVVAKSAHREAGSFERQMILAIDAIVTAKVLD